MKNIVRFFKFITQYKKYAFLGCLSVLVNSCMMIPIPLFYKKIVDNALANKNIKLLFIFISIIICLLIIEQLTHFFQIYFFSNLREKVFHDIRSTLYERLQSISHIMFNKKQTGGMLSRMTSDVDSAQYLLADNMILLIRDSLYTLGTVIILFTIDWQLTLLAVIILPFFYIAFVVFGRKIFFLSKELQKQNEIFMGTMGELISGTKHIQMVGVEKKYLSKAKEKIKALEKARKNIFVQSALANFSTVIIAILAIIIIWGVGGLKVIFTGMSLGTIVAINTYFVTLYNPILNIFNSNLNIQASLASAERIFDMIDNTQEDDNIKNEILLDKKTSESIIFKNIIFRYEENEETILNGININLNVGEIIGIVGNNGAGKSTLWKLLCRFYELEKGEIFIGKDNIKNIKKTSLRNYISFVPQEDFVFNATIYENIVLGRDITDEKFNDILKISTLNKIIDRFPFGLNTVVGERGSILSGGEKQRIMIARALVSDPNIIFIDEGFTQIDFITKKDLLMNLKEITTQGKMVVVIAHEKEILEYVDRLIVLDRGLVKYDGVCNEFVIKKFYCEL